MLSKELANERNRAKYLEPLLNLRQAAVLLNVSQGYLRASDCPRILLPGNGPAARPLIRYSRHEVEAWARRRGNSTEVDGGRD